MRSSHSCGYLLVWSRNGYKVRHDTPCFFPFPHSCSFSFNVTYILHPCQKSAVPWTVQQTRKEFSSVTHRSHRRGQRLKILFVTFDLEPVLDPRRSPCVQNLSVRSTFSFSQLSAQILHPVHWSFAHPGVPPTNISLDLDSSQASFSPPTSSPSNIFKISPAVANPHSSRS